MIVSIEACIGEYGQGIVQIQDLMMTMESKKARLRMIVFFRTEIIQQ